MKDEDSTPFEPVGDESLEARIVAWVLGDASAFEAVELERLCEERPELLVFRRRMQALHGLLTEDEAAQPDEAWKLPADKRGKIEALFGEMHAAAPEVTVLATPKRRYQPWIRQTLIASAACLALAAGFHQVFKPQGDHGSVVKMSQAPRDVDFMPSGGGGGQQGFGNGSAPRSSLPVAPDARRISAKGASSSFVLPEPESSEGIASVGSLQGNRGLSGGLGGSGSDGGRGEGNGRGFGNGAAPSEPDTTLATRDQEQAAPRVPSPAPAPTIAPGQFGSARGGRAAGAPADRASGYVGSDDQIAWSDADVPPPAVVTGGNRLGDDAISRNSIDATLTNPNRPSARPTPAGPGAAAPPVDALAKNEKDGRFKFSVQDEGKKAQLADGPKGSKPGEKTMQDGGEIADAKKAAAEPVPSGGVEGEIHIGASSDYIFRGSDRGHGLAEAGADVSKEAPKNDLSDLDTLRKLSGGDQLNVPDHDSELDIYGQVSKGHGLATGKVGGVWYGAIEDSGSRAAAPFDTPAGSLDYRYASQKDDDIAGSPLQAKGSSELGLDGMAPKDSPAVGRLFGDGVKGNSANRADVAKNKSGPTTNTEEVRYKLDADAAPLAAADPFAAPAPPISAATPTPTGAGARDQLVARAEAKPKVEIVREFQYPTEAEPPELPNGAPQAQDKSGPQDLAANRQAVTGKDAEQKAPATTDDHSAKVNEIRKSLYIGEGNFNLGKYDEAKREYENALRIDPYNSAAPRGMERVNAAKSDYYRAAYDHTRAELLMQVDKSSEELKKSLPDQDRSNLLMEVDRAWELAGAASSIPELENAIEKEQAGLKELEDKLNPKKEAIYFHYKSQENLQSAKRTLALLKAEIARGINLTDGRPLTPAQLKELNRKVSDREDEIEEHQKLDDTIRRTKGGPDVVAENRNTDPELSRQLKAAQDRMSVLSDRLFAARMQAILKAAPAKPTPVVPTDETSATEEPFSTFSLHVSDASFKLAKAALDRGDRPSPDQIRIEEFYNAFDYGDPSPAPGEQVACAIEQGAHPVLPQRNIVRVGMRVGSSGRSAGQPLNLTVLLDNSGSMEREDRNAGLKAAVAQLASLLKPGDTVTLAGFSRTPHLLADRLPGADAKKLIELVDKLPSEGGTNLEEALKLAGELAIQRRNPAAQNRIVLLTDGAANLGNAQPEELSNKVAELRQQGIAFDAAGICAGGLNDRMLEALTRNGNGRYYIVNSPADADANFARQLAGAFRPAAENVKVQVHFNPARVARYKLIGFEKHRLNKEDFHNDKVDAAELAADEAGVALYQVETLPQGTGEIGEVSVRFRDTSSGEMIERSWTIPHDEKTPAFDKASPSVQLATLAALAAEKLRGGPLADATDFSSLVPQVARVRSYYANSSRVGEFVDMTGKLK